MTGEAAKPASVLVVDDDDETRELLSFALQGRGFQVTSACNGLEALDVLQVPQDVIVLDLQMPLMDGRQFLRARPPELMATPVIVLSASADRMDLNGTPSVVAILSKPCDVSRLVALLGTVLGPHA